MKMGLYRNVAKTDPMARGYVAFPRGLEDEYFRQLTAERRTAEKRHGFTVWRWTKDPSQANEGLDTILQAEAAAIKWGVRGLPDAMWDKLEEERERPAAGQQIDLEDYLSAPRSAPAALPPEQLPNPVPKPADAPRRFSRSGSKSSFMDR
jgi:phage terminase large subunit GpA-like protein